jgi:multiple sugar transport system permease protein
MEVYMKHIALKIIKWAVSILIAFTALFPFYWVLISSFKTGDTILVPDLWPVKWTLQHYRELIGTTGYLPALKSSIIIAAGTMILTIIIVILASYALYRFDFRGRSIFEKIILITYIFPSILLVVPVYNVMVKIDLIDTPLALIIMNVTFAAPFCVWLMRGFFKSISYSLDESASIDGAGKMTVLYRILIPILKPGIATIIIYSFISSWTEYTFASILVSSDANKTLPIALHAIMGQYTVRWGHTTAGAVLTILPILIAFTFIGKYFISGLTEGAVKE